MKIESRQFKRILRHTCEYDGNYRNKVFTNLSESDLKFVRTQTSKNVPSEDNRFEDYVISFSDDDLSMLFDCFESINNENVEQAIKIANKDIVVGAFLSTKIIESIIDSNHNTVGQYLDYDKDKIEILKGVFQSGDPRGLSYAKLGFLYPNHTDIWHLSNHAKNTMVFNFIVDRLEEDVESDVMLQESINDYMLTTKHTVSRIYTNKDRLTTTLTSSGRNYIQPVHDYDLVTGIEYNPSM